jgi:hypothetical protein
VARDGALVTEDTPVWTAHVGDEEGDDEGFVAFFPKKWLFSHYLQ